MDTQNGALGHLVANHVEEGSSNVRVLAASPNQETEEETVVDWGQLSWQDDVTLSVAQANISLLLRHSTNERTDKLNQLTLPAALYGYPVVPEIVITICCIRLTYQ